MQAFTQHRVSLSLFRAIIRQSLPVSLVLLTFTLPACVAPVKPVPTQESQEAAAPLPQAIEMSKPADPAPSAPEAPVVPLPPVGESRPETIATQEEIPVVEAKPVMVMAQRDAYTVTHATTATKTDTPLMETPVSVQVVPKQVLQDQRVNRLQEALENVSGIRSHNTDLEGYVFKIRGFDSFTQRSVS